MINCAQQLFSAENTNLTYNVVEKTVAASRTAFAAQIVAISH